MIFFSSRIRRHKTEEQKMYSIVRLSHHHKTNANDKQNLFLIFKKIKFPGGL